MALAIRRTASTRGRILVWQLRPHLHFPSVLGFIPVCGPPACSLAHRNASRVSAQFETRLMPEDILHLRATSMRIMQDTICELEPGEMEKCLVHREKLSANMAWWSIRRLHLHATDSFNRVSQVKVRYNDLLLDRLRDRRLLMAFNIKLDFNMQAYFLILHAWLLHQRLVLEGAKAKKIDDDLFESCWMHVRNWMFLKRVPEFRFDADLKNVQEYMLGCCVALDKALERPDILPARIQQVLWRNVYSATGDRDATALMLLTKYVIRQLGLMLQLDAEHFLAGNFVWADFPIPDSVGQMELSHEPPWRKKFFEEMDKDKE